MKYIRLIVLCSLAVLLGPHVVLATVAEDDIPWSHPIARIVVNLRDVLAPMAIIGGIAFIGLTMAFTEHNSGFRRAIPFVIGGAIALNVTRVMAAFGWSGATF